MPSIAWEVGTPTLSLDSFLLVLLFLFWSLSVFIIDQQPLEAGQSGPERT